MHVISGVFSLDKTLPNNLFSSNVIFEENKIISMQAESDSVSKFIQTVETKKSFAICTGYFDQPLSENRKITLDSIVAAYEINGELPSVDLFGSFQCFLFDKKSQRLLLFSDRGALRTIFYCISENVLYFSTKVKVIQKLTHVAQQPNISQRDFSLIYGFYPENTTVYENVKKLASGKGLSIQSGSLQEIFFTGHKEFVIPNLKSEDEVVEQLYKDLFSAVEKQTEGYDRVAVLLGGFDSALIASFLKRLGKEVETYTFSFNDDEFNQTHTSTLAKFLDIKHNWVDITPKVFKDSLPNYPQFFDQPTNWANYIVQTAYATEFIKKDGFEICLSGDGCDTLFQGYPGVNRSAKLYKKISPLIKPFSRPLIWLFNNSALERNLGHVYRLIMRVIRNAITKDPLRTYLMFRIFDESTISRTFKNLSYNKIISNVEKQSLLIAQLIPKDSTLNKLAYLGRSNMGPNRAKLSGSMDLTGMIIHSPFMHNEIKKIVGLYPDELLRPKDSGNTMQDIGKYILTKMTQKYELLPDEIIFQKKQAPVNSPIDNWYQNELAETVEVMLSKSPWEIDIEFVNKGLVEKKWAEEVYKQRFSSDQVASHALSLLLTTLAFYER